MLKINPIKNVQYTLNNKIPFTSGVQTNRGVEVPPPETNLVEGNLVTGFVGTIAPLFHKTKAQRAESIKEGLENKLNLIA